jgi:hypothetical protein
MMVLHHRDNIHNEFQNILLWVEVGVEEVDLQGV